MPKTNRPKKFQLRLSQLEWDKSLAMAKKEGMTRSELFRAKTIYRRLPRRVTTIAAKTYWELSRIGNNLNQLAKKANTAIKMGQPPPTDPGTLEELKTLLKQTRRELVELDLLAQLDEESDDERGFSNDWKAD